MMNGYNKIIEILEKNRFRSDLERIDYTLSWEEPDRVKGLDLEATKKRGYCSQVNL